MSEFSNKLIAWYHKNKRDLPWRNTNDPYKIWLSEIILQQTRVQQGMPYYLSFVDNFQSVEDLASAEEEKVLRLWQGLGYYSRARNLHFASKQVVNEFQGVFPNTFAEIKRLKGVGDYTAAAIASFAFNEKVPVVDGNVIRVITRFFGLDEDISKNSTLKKIRSLANDLLPDTDHDTFNQAIMEFGALHCVPANPDCKNCIFSDKCMAFRNDKVKELPFKSAKIKKRSRYFYYLVLKYKEKIALEKRGSNDIWQGLYEFPLVEQDTQTDVGKVLKRVPQPYTFQKETELKKHILSHQTIFPTFIEVELHNKIEDYSYYNIKEISELPKSILIEKYLQKNIFY